MGKQNRELTDRITAELQEQILREGLASDIPAFSLPSTRSGNFTGMWGEKEEHLRESRYCAQLLNDTPVQYDRKLGSYVPILTPLVVFVKRIIRKLVRFLFEPMVDEINTNRQMTATAIDELLSYTEIQSEEIRMLQKDLSSLRSDVLTVQKENEKLRSLLLAEMDTKEKEVNEGYPTM